MLQSFKIYQVTLVVVLMVAGSVLPQAAFAQPLAAEQYQSLTGYPGAPEIHPERRQAVRAALAEREIRNQSRSGDEDEGLQLLGYLDLGVSSDVWAHEDFAYVGGFFDFFTGSGFTPVRIIDIHDPENPILVAELPSFEGSPQDVKVAEIETPYFEGDLLAVANDGGAPPTFGGFQLYDVSDPANPVELSHPRIGPVHNLFLFQRDERAFILLAISFAEVFTPISPPFITIGDFVIFEVTDPTAPVMLSDWGAGKDGGFPYGFPFPIGSIPPTCLDPDICRGSSPFVFCHDVWANEDGTVAYLSYWDLGLILLDISDPADPAFIGRGVAPSTFGNDEGNLHVAVPTEDEDFVLTGDEDFDPLPWGFLRVFDTDDPGSPFQVGAFATDGSLNDPTLERTMHNLVIDDEKAFISWYFEGILVMDIDDPATPREIARFTAPPGTGPGNFWGVYQDDDLVLGSDFLSGLFILELEDEEEEEEEESKNGDGRFADKTGVAAPTEFAVLENYPDPFNPETTLRFRLPETEQVMIRIFNALGQEVRTLTNRNYPAGEHSLRWNGNDDAGNPAPSGVYLYQIRAGAFSEVHKMTLLR